VGNGEAFALPPHIYQVGHGVGQPMPDPVRQKMESFFGTDFSYVRIHVGPQATAIGALAYTQGSNLYFAHGQYNPHTPQGQQLLGHELAHVVQQRAGRVRNPFGSGVAVVQDRGLELEADQLGRRAAAHPVPAHPVLVNPVQAKPVPQSSFEPKPPAPRNPALPRAGAAPVVARVAAPHSAPAANAHGTSIQRYSVLGPSNIYTAMPAKRPWFFYPYAVISSATFPGQTIVSGIEDKDAFLTKEGGRKANIVNKTGGLSLRVSDDGNMAIEHSNLQRRQPKVFFATSGVLAAANLALEKVKSSIRLERGVGQITLLTGWSSQKQLYAIKPTYLGVRNKNPDLLPQNCNAVAALVTGNNSDRLAMSGVPLATAKKIVPEAAETLKKAFDDRRIPISTVEGLEEDMIRQYARPWDYGPVHREGANEFATPDVGEAYMIASLGKGTDLGGGRARLYDYASRKFREVGWRFHFGGVVARSGGDRITLENFARGDNRVSEADPRWYFQMYSENYGQSFHEAYAGTADYANPITVRI